MPVFIQIEGTRAILGLDPDIPYTWSSDEVALAERLNEEAPHYRGNRPDPEFAEAEAVVRKAIALGKDASIEMVDPEGEADDDDQAQINF